MLRCLKYLHLGVPFLATVAAKVEDESVTLTRIAHQPLHCEKHVVSRGNEPRILRVVRQDTDLVHGETSAKSKCIDIS